MKAYLTESDQKENSLKWADKILKHALVCYSEKGRICYEEVKANSGKEMEAQDYKKISIHPIPLIQEITIPIDDDKNIGFNLEKTILSVDMSVFSWKYFEDFGQGNNKNTYLFGIQSAMLLFARGINKLCQVYQDNDETLEEIKEAEKYFNYSWNIAEEQLQIVNDQQPGNKNISEFRRGYVVKQANLNDLESKIILNYLNKFSIGSLYPHRFTQFADLGKIFAVVCLVITSSYKDATLQENHVKIKFLIERLKDDNFNNPTVVLGQERYNIHLKEVYEKFGEYIYQIQSKNMGNDISAIRNNIVSEVFKIILAKEFKG